MTAEVIRVRREWLDLRERADGAARARDLVEHLVRATPASDRWTIHDLGCGTGAMGRWLAPLLPGAQHWILHDRDVDLLEIALGGPPGAAADGATVTVEARRSDITRLGPDDLAGASLITASALLDILAEDELARLVAVCTGAGCPTLLTMCVSGRVEIAPPDPLDGRVAIAFDAHQRRRTDRGRLLGPDAVTLAAEEFRGLGADVIIRPSAWLLTASQDDLLAEWFTGWVAAGCEQQVELAAEADGYTRRRLAQATAGQLTATVDHADILVLPRRSQVERP